MAFLGPPSSAYPPDPENYVFYRVGGGYASKIVSAGGVARSERAGLCEGCMQVFDPVQNVSLSHLLVPPLTCLPLV